MHANTPAVLTMSGGGVCCGQGSTGVWLNQNGIGQIFPVHDHYRNGSTTTRLPKNLLGIRKIT